MMADPIVVMLVTGAAAGIGWVLGRRPRGFGLRSGAAPHLLPDPALDWLRRAHQATGVWITELDPKEEGPRRRSSR
jgi:hypothetical protein